jgi:hypothetical protein
MESETTEVSLRRTTWLPRWRATTQPAFSKARTASAPDVLGSPGNEGDLDFPKIDGKGEPRLPAGLQAEGNGFANVRESLLLGAPLAGASRNRRTIDDEPALFIRVHRDDDLHERSIPAAEPPTASRGRGRIAAWYAS